MGLDNIEWYDSPTSDEEVIQLADRLTSSPVRSNDRVADTGAQWVRSSKNWGWFKWSMWSLAMLFASVWALFFGAVGGLLCITVIGAPFGAYLIIVAGLPGAALIAMVGNTKEMVVPSS